ncbi:MAG: nucleotidyltransferase family protein [Acidobacteria bacterium]|nr:nucleotidyltransferase family protein [Acidobacteriota bacterium]
MFFSSQTAALLRSIVAPCGDPQPEQIAAFVSSIDDWEEVLSAASQHRVLPALFSRLSRYSEGVPKEILQTLRGEYERNAFHCLTNTAELHAVVGAFQESGIRVMPFKGVTLAASAYGGISGRNAGDLDLLVGESDLQRATLVLKDRGYVLTTPVGEDGKPLQEGYYELHFDRIADGMAVELRWRLELTRRFGAILGLEWVWPSRRQVSVAGREVPCFDPVRNLLMLCMHGSKHRWSRLMWVCDVAKAVESEPSLDWNAVFAEAERTGLHRALALGVILANRLADARVPEPVLKRLERDKSMRAMAEFFAEHLISEPGTIPAGRVPYNIQLLGFRDRMRPVVTGEFMTPNDQDRAFVALPRSLHALYYLIRPIRILMDRSGR